MSMSWLRRLALVAACSATVLAGCGSGSIESQLTPSRVVTFGDGFADLGQRGVRYTINDGSVNNWTQEVAGRFGLPLAASASGGLSYATGSARVNTQPDAVGVASTPTVAQQVSAFLSSQSVGANDLLILNAGVADVIAEVARFNAGQQTNSQMLEQLGQAGRDLGAQVRRLVEQAGATHVVVMGPYNLGRSPWAKASGQQGVLESAVGKFNEELLVSIADLGAKVLYVDAAFYLNLVTASPGAYTFTDSTSVVCTSVDPGVGIGIGGGQVNSTLCTPATVVAGLDPKAYVFADPVYLTPEGNRRLGDYAYDRIRARW